MPEPKGWESAFEVDMNSVVPNSWNPNHMPNGTFSELVGEIEKEGFDQPIIVIPHPTETGKWLIVDGEHRYKAKKVLGDAKIAVVVKKDWDEVKAKLETVRRNVLRGDLDSAKFSSLVNSIALQHNVFMESMPKLMGFADDAAFNAYYKKEKEKVDDRVTAMVQETKKEVQLVDNVSFLLQEIFTQSGDTVQQSFMSFFHQNRLQLLLQMGPELSAEVARLDKTLRRNQKDINDVLVGVLKKINDDNAEKSVAK